VGYLASPLPAAGWVGIGDQHVLQPRFGGAHMSRQRIGRQASGGPRLVVLPPPASITQPRRGPPWGFRLDHRQSACLKRNRRAHHSWAGQRMECQTSPNYPLVGPSAPSNTEAATATRLSNRTGLLASFSGRRSTSRMLGAVGEQHGHGRCRYPSPAGGGKPPQGLRGSSSSTPWAS